MLDDVVAMLDVDNELAEVDGDVCLRITTLLGLTFSVDESGNLLVHSTPSCEVIHREPLFPLLREEIAEGDCAGLVDVLRLAMAEVDAKPK